MEMGENNSWPMTALSMVMASCTNNDAYAE